MNLYFCHFRVHAKGFGRLILPDEPTSVKGYNDKINFGSTKFFRHGRFFILVIPLDWTNILEEYDEKSLHST